MFSLVQFYYSIFLFLVVMCWFQMIFIASHKLLTLQITNIRLHLNNLATRIFVKISTNHLFIIHHFKILFYISRFHNLTVILLCSLWCSSYSILSYFLTKQLYRFLFENSIFYLKILTCKITVRSQDYITFFEMFKYFWLQLNLLFTICSWNQ